MNSAERRGNKVVATAAKSTRRNRRSYTIRTGNKPTSNRRRKKQEKLPRGVQKIALQERRAKRAEANGKSNETTTKRNKKKKNKQRSNEKVVLRLKKYNLNLTSTHMTLKQNVTM